MQNGEIKNCLQGTKVNKKQSFLVLITCAVINLQLTPTMRAASCAQKPNHLLSFDQATWLAQERRDDLYAFEYARRASVDAERAAFSGYLPQIKVTTRVSEFLPELIFFPEADPKECTEKRHWKRLTFHFSQLLLQGGGPLSDYEIAKEGTQIVLSQEREARNNAQIATQKAFLNAQKLLLEKQFIETKNKTSKVIFAKNSCQNIVGFLDRPAWLSATETYAQDQSAVANYEFDVQTAHAQLERETNTLIPIEQIDLCLDGITNITLEPLNYYIRAALIFRPELETQEHTIHQAKLNEMKYRRKYLPSVNFFSRVTNISIREGRAPENWVVGLDFSWNFDGFAAIHTSRQSHDQAIQFQLQKRDFELNLINKVKILYYQLKTLVNTLKVARFNLGQQKANLQKSKTQLEVGSIARPDFAQAQLSYDSALFNYTATKIDIRTTYQTLLYTCGYPKQKKTNRRVVTCP